MSYFEVVCRCGHVGNGKYVLKSFAVYAKNAKSAARKARQIPRVKHHNKHAIESVTEIDEERFREIIDMNYLDPYFQCCNKTEQKAVCDDLEIKIDYSLTGPEIEEDRDSVSRRVIYSGKSKIKNPRKFVRLYDFSEGIAI